MDLVQNAFSSDHDRTLKSDRTSEIESSLDVVRLTFPIGIAALRNAYQTAQENLATSNKKREQQLPQVTLPLSYRANEIREQENLPVAATTQTPLSQDAVLQQITRTLRERDIKAVMIFATDSLDSLFLLHYLRETCPNIRIALPGADLLYVVPPILTTSQALSFSLRILCLAAPRRLCLVHRSRTRQRPSAPRTNSRAV